MRLVFFKAFHKYIKRTGVSGGYKYWYRDEFGRVFEGVKPKKEEINYLPENVKKNKTRIENEIDSWKKRPSKNKRKIIENEMRGIEEDKVRNELFKKYNDKLIKLPWIPSKWERPEERQQQKETKLL